MENREKQIEKMAKNVCHLDRTCDECMTSFECKAMMYAKRFYNAGYRKASEVAREIFAEIENVMSSLDRRYMASGNPKQSWGVRGAMAELEELKKKYTEDGE
jgi:hypothetical protein